MVEREICLPGSNGVVGAEHHVVPVDRVELQGLAGGTEAGLLVTQPNPRLDLLEDLHTDWWPCGRCERARGLLTTERERAHTSHSQRSARHSAAANTAANTRGGLKYWKYQNYFFTTDHSQVRQSRARVTSESL